MTNTQLYLAIGVPILFNGLGLVAVYVLLLNRISATDARITDGYASLSARIDAGFKAVDVRFEAVNTRFDDMRDLWRAELHRVEEVLDARLKHLEEH